MPGLFDPTPTSQYTLYEMVNKKPGPILGHFDSLTGGDQVISMVKYNVIDKDGNVTTKYMPGQTTFEAVELLRPMDAVAQEVYLLFFDAILGKVKTLRKNYSVSMNDANGNPLVWWNLINALPTKVSGFSFNEHVEAEYTSFEISLIPEAVEIIFDEKATSDAVSAAIDYWTKKEGGELEEPEEPEEPDAGGDDAAPSE
jgi:phage tail-like protein